jgi:diguanylate cyclase (GGDEF)-like protein
MMKIDVKQPEFLQTIVDHVPSGLFVVDDKREIIAANQKFEYISKKEQAEIAGKLFGEALGCSFTVEENKPCGETSQCHKCMLKNSVEHSISTNTAIRKQLLERHLYIGNRKQQKYLEFTVEPFSYDDNALALVTLNDITEQELQKKQLRTLAKVDGLTGLLRHMETHKQLQQMIENKELLSIIALDIDYFKKINDQHGHLVGDDVLRAVAQCIKGSVRKSDIVGRVGGEEFLVILPDVPHESAVQIAEKIRKKIEVLVPASVPITISGGVTEHLDTESIEEVLERADQLLYAAKKQGRNRIVSEMK